MPHLTVSDEVHRRVLAFKQVVDRLLGEEISFDDYVDVVLGQGLDAIQANILGSVDQETMMRSFQQLSAQHPENVCAFVAETLRKGSATPAREEARRRLGFHPETDSTS